MHARIFRGACWLAAVLALAPATARAQEPSYAPDPWPLPLPIGSTRPEEGGFFVNTSYAMYRYSNPLKNQLIAIRGFKVFDDSLGVAPGTFIGPGTHALNVDSLNDDRTWQPGFTFNIGWKFRDQSAIELNWFWLTGTQYRQGATPITPNGPFFADLSNTYLFANVYNTPLEYSGPPNKVRGASEFGVFGLWNGATIMTESFRQRFQQWEITWRTVVFEQEDMRISALVGPRFAWFWEDFQWRSVNYDADGGGGGGVDTGLYSNITSNRMYGVHGGMRCEGYWGAGFGYQCEGQGAIFLNSVKERAKYETGEKYGGLPESKFARREFTIVPELQGSVGVTWNPREAIQFVLKYEGMVFFNTMSSPRPVALDYLNPRPKWESTIRYLHGFQAAVGIHF